MGGKVKGFWRSSGAVGVNSDSSACLSFCGCDGADKVSWETFRITVRCWFSSVWGKSAKPSFLLKWITAFLHKYLRKVSSNQNVTTDINKSNLLLQYYKINPDMILNYLASSRMKPQGLESANCLLRWCKTTDKNSSLLQEKQTFAFFLRWGWGTGCFSSIPIMLIVL